MGPLSPPGVTGAADTGAVSAGIGEAVDFATCRRTTPLAKRCNGSSYELEALDDSGADIAPNFGGGA